MLLGKCKRIFLVASLLRMLTLLDLGGAVMDADTGTEQREERGGGEVPNDADINPFVRIT